MPQVLIPSALRAFTGRQATVRIPGHTVQEVLQNLVEHHPDLRRHLFDETGRVRNFVNVFVGEEDIRQLQSGATPVQEEDTVSLVPAVAGGV